MGICGGRAFQTEGKEGTTSARALGHECTRCVQGVAKRPVCLEQHEPGEGVGRNEDREVGDRQAHRLSNLSSFYHNSICRDIGYKLSAIRRITDGPPTDIDERKTRNN